MRGTAHREEFGLRDKGTGAPSLSCSTGSCTRGCPTPCQECLISLGVILEDPQGEQDLATSSPVVHPEHSNSKAQSSGMSQLNRQMQHHQLPPAHPSPSAPGKHLSTGRELPQVQALRGCLELGSRLDSFFQNTQREKYKIQHPRVFPTETTA